MEEDGKIARRAWCAEHKECEAEHEGHEAHEEQNEQKEQKEHFEQKDQDEKN